MPHYAFDVDVRSLSHSRHRWLTMRFPLDRLGVMIARCCRSPRAVFCRMPFRRRQLPRIAVSPASTRARRLAVCRQKIFRRAFSASLRDAKRKTASSSGSSTLMGADAPRRRCAMMRCRDRAARLLRRPQHASQFHEHDAWSISHASYARRDKMSSRT